MNYIAPSSIATKAGTLTSATQTLAAARSEVLIRRPKRTDGLAVNALIARSPPLDTNSLYCNLLQCTHFSDTSAVADCGSDIVGFASGYLVPGRMGPALFIWQVAVDQEFRGQSIGRNLILDIWARRCCANTQWIELTIGLENGASWNLFEGIARELGARTRREVMFDRQLDFDDQHESEIKLRIGPIARHAIHPMQLMEEIAS